MWEVATDQMRSLWILPLLEDVFRSIEGVVGVVGVVQFRAGVRHLRRLRVAPSDDDDASRFGCAS
jgi:hypothetical protein